MSKLLMSCDDRIVFHQGHYYASSAERMEFYQRYLRVFDSVRLVCRCEEERDLRDTWVPIETDPRIEIVPIPIFHGPKEYFRVYWEIGHITRDVTKGCEAAILRIPSTIALRVGRTVMRSQIPYACEVVFDAVDGWKGEKGINRLLWKRIDKQMRDLCAKADGVSCVTENYLQQHYYSTNVNAFSSHYSSLSLPLSFYTGSRVFPTHRPFVIAHIANQVQFNGRKGHSELLRAVSLLKKKGIITKVRFAGRDYYGGIAKLQGLSKSLGVEDQVEFVGYLNRESLNHFLDDSDLFVFPTRAEGLPRVIIEAMAKGLPCTTTPVSGNPELIDSHFLVPYENIDMLADRIEELLTMPDVYEQASCVNYERSQKYEASFLQTRRDEFYSKLKECTQKQ